MLGHDSAVFDSWNERRVVQRRMTAHICLHIARRVTVRNRLYFLLARTASCRSLASRSGPAPNSAYINHCSDISPQDSMVVMFCVNVDVLTKHNMFIFAYSLMVANRTTVTCFSTKPREQRASSKCAQLAWRWEKEQQHYKDSKSSQDPTAMVIDTKIRDAEGDQVGGQPEATEVVGVRDG